MVPGLLEEIEKVFSWYELQKEEKILRSLQGAVERHDVGVLR